MFCKSNYINSNSLTMAKIKTEKIKIDNIGHEVQFHCSSSGEFSLKCQYIVSERLNLEQKKCKENSLQEIQSYFHDCYNQYINSVTSFALKIGITFGASGDFTKNDLNEFIIFGNNYIRNTSYSDFDSLLGFDYRVMIEEKVNESYFYYEAIPIKKYDGTIYEWNKVFHDWIGKKKIHSFNNNEVIIDFSEQALTNLKAISIQLRNAAEYLNNLINHDNLQRLINSEFPKQNILTNS